MCLQQSMRENCILKWKYNSIFFFWVWVFAFFWHHGPPWNTPPAPWERRSFPWVKDHMDEFLCLADPPSQMTAYSFSCMLAWILPHERSCLGQGPRGSLTTYLEWVLSSCCGSFFTFDLTDDDTTPNPMPSHSPPHCEERKPEAVKSEPKPETEFIVIR